MKWNTFPMDYIPVRNIFEMIYCYHLLDFAIMSEHIVLFWELPHPTGSCTPAHPLVILCVGTYVCALRNAMPLETLADLKVLLECPPSATFAADTLGNLCETETI